MRAPLLCPALSCACLVSSFAVILQRPRKEAKLMKDPHHMDKEDVSEQKEDSQDQVNRTQAFRQEMRNYKDSQYYGKVKVGTQVLEGVLDTGSTELVVLSDKCKSQCGRKTEELYHAMKSSNYQHGPLALDISYGSGDLNGREAYDSVSIGPFESKDVPFWEVMNANMPILASSEFEAIVGLGPIPPHVQLMSPGSPRNNLSYALVLRKLNLFRYSVCLSRQPGAPGYLTWMDDSHLNYPKLFTKLEVIDTTYWMSRMTDVTLGKQPFTLCSSGCGAIIDSGTSLLAVPKKVFKKLAPIIEKMGEKASCNVNLLPDIRFKLDGVHYSLPPDSYIGTIYGDVPSALLQNFQKKTNASCQTAMMAMDLPSTVGDTWVLGVPFLRNFLTIFEQGKKPKMFTARASDDCYVAKGDKLALHPKGKRSARHIDASKLRLPQWLHKAKQLGSLRQMETEQTGPRVLKSAAEVFHPKPNNKKSGNSDRKDGNSKE